MLSVFHDNSSLYRSECFADGVKHGDDSPLTTKPNLSIKHHDAQVQAPNTDATAHSDTLNNTFRQRRMRGDQLLSPSSRLLQGQRHGPRVCYADNGRTAISTSTFSHGSGCLWSFRDKLFLFVFSHHHRLPLTPNTINALISNNQMLIRLPPLPASRSVRNM
jgi:hypothetical protein